MWRKLGATKGGHMSLDDMLLQAKFMDLLFQEAPPTAAAVAALPGVEEARMVGIIGSALQPRRHTFQVALLIAAIHAEPPGVLADGEAVCACTTQ